MAYHLQSLRSCILFIPRASIVISQLVRKENGTVINIRDNTVAFLPHYMAVIGICNKPFITEEVASLAEVKTPYEELLLSNNSSYMLQSIESRTIPHMDQIKFKAQVITDPTLKLRPGTTVMITSGIAPAPYIIQRG